MEYPEFPKRNSKRWALYTNRHRSTQGNSWGWIEGPAGNVCWSNDNGSKFTLEQASAAVRAHNEWLNNQRSITVRILEQQEARDSLTVQIENKKAELNAMLVKLNLIDEKIAELSK